MKRHPSDRHIRQQLEHYHTPVNAEALWANIEPVVQPKKDSRKFLFLWLLFGLLLIISAFSYFISAENTTAPSSIETTIANQIQSTPNQTPESSTTKIQDQAQTSNEPQTEPIPTSQANKINDNPSSISENTSFQNSTLTPTSVQKSSIQENSTVKSPIINNNPQINKTPITSETIDEANLVSTQQNQIQKPNNNSSFNKQLALLPIISPTSLTKAAFPELPESMNAQPVTSSRDYGFSPWSATLRLGIGSTLRDLNGNDNSTELLNIRNRTEEQLETFTFEGGIQWQSKGNWYLRSGLGYRQSVERFKFSSADTSTVVDPEGIIRIIIGSNGDTLRIETGEVTGRRISSLEKTTYNRLRYFEIPIIAGYTFGEGPFSFGVEAGVVPQFLVNVSGEILNERADILSFSEVIETSVAFSLHSAFNINYDINQSWQVQLSPTFRYQFSNLHKSDYPLSVSYHSFGLQVGLRYSW